MNWWVLILAAVFALAGVLIAFHWGFSLWRDRRRYETVAARWDHLHDIEHTDPEALKAEVKARWNTPRS